MRIRQGYGRSGPATVARCGVAPVDPAARAQLAAPWLLATYTWLLEPMIRRAGYDIEDADYSSDGFSAKYVARAVERYPGRGTSPAA
jgi:hypothetical protein